MKENGCSKLLLAEVATQHRVSGRMIQKQQFDTEDHRGEGVRIFILEMGGSLLKLLYLASYLI